MSRPLTIGPFPSQTTNAAEGIESTDAAAAADEEETNRFSFAHALASTRKQVNERKVKAIPSTSASSSSSLRVSVSAASKESKSEIDPTKQRKIDHRAQSATENTHNTTRESATPAPAPPSGGLTVLSRSNSGSSNPNPNPNPPIATRLSPRIPTVPHLSRGGRITQPNTPSAQAATLVSSIPSSSSSSSSSLLPLACDLVSPADLPAASVAFASWSSPIEAPQLPVPALPPSLDSDDLSSLSPAWRALLSRQEAIEHVRRDPAVHALIRAGVPDLARPRLWKLLSGSNEMRRKYSNDYYDKLILYHRTHGSAYDDEIRRDLARTLPGVELFNPRKQPPLTQAEIEYAAGTTSTSNGNLTSPDSLTTHIPANGSMTTLSYGGQGGLARLNRVLCAYAMRNHTLGYCQGMNHIAGTLLTLLDEESSFWVLTVLIESRIGLYCKSMCGLEVDQQVFGSMVAYYLPKIHAHLRTYDVSIPSFTVSWFVCLFVEAPLSDLPSIYAVWDWMMVRGDEFLFTMSLALLKTREEEILRKKDTGELLEFLLHTGFKRTQQQTITPTSTNHTPISNGTTPTPNVDGGVYGDTPSDILQLLHHDIPLVGSLSREIASLREYHKNDVLKKCKILNHHTAQRLVEAYKFPSIDHVQRLWCAFLAPSPWSILLHGALIDCVKFYESFCVEVFPETIRMKWKDFGLFSGLVERLFHTIDAERRGEITFEQYLAGVSLFTRPAAEEERCRFAFRFYDIDGDGYIGHQEMTTVFKMFQQTYHGTSLGLAPIGGNSTSTDGGGGGDVTDPFSDRLPMHRIELESRSSSVDADVDPLLHSSSPAIPSSSTPPPASSVANEDVSALFVSLIFAKAADIAASAARPNGNRAQDDAGTGVASILGGLYASGLSYTLFRQVISLHTFSQQTFGLKKPESRVFGKKHDKNVKTTKLTPTPTTATATVAAPTSVPVSATPVGELGMSRSHSQQSSATSTPNTATKTIDPNGILTTTTSTNPSRRSSFNLMIRPHQPANPMPTVTAAAPTTPTIPTTNTTTTTTRYNGTHGNVV